MSVYRYSSLLLNQHHINFITKQCDENGCKREEVLAWLIRRGLTVEYMVENSSGTRVRGRGFKRFPYNRGNAVVDMAIAALGELEYKVNLSLLIRTVIEEERKRERERRRGDKSAKKERFK